MNILAAAVTGCAVALAPCSAAFAADTSVPAPTVSPTAEPAASAGPTSTPAPTVPPTAEPTATAEPTSTGPASDEMGDGNGPGSDPSSLPADEGKPVPGQPPAEPTSEPAATTPGLNRPVCDREAFFVGVKRAGQDFVKLGVPTGVVNKGATKATLTRTITVSGSATLSGKGSVTIEASVLVAGAKATGEVGLAATLTVSDSMAASMEVRPGKTGMIQPGIIRSGFTGAGKVISAGNCKETSGSVTTFIPHAPGFETSGG